MYTITTSPGGYSGTAETIPRLGRAGNQLTIGVAGRPGHLNGRLDLLQEAVDQLADELYTQLHRATMATGCPRGGSVDGQERR